MRLSGFTIHSFYKTSRHFQPNTKMAKLWVDNEEIVKKGARTTLIGQEKYVDDELYRELRLKVKG